VGDELKVFSITFPRNAFAFTISSYVGFIEMLLIFWCIWVHRYAIFIYLIFVRIIFRNMTIPIFLTMGYVYRCIFFGGILIF